MASARDDTTWQDTARIASSDELLAPRTQIVGDRDTYLGQGRHDVGRRIAEGETELFISADVAGSLQQEFAQHTPEFVTLHDVGTSASLRLLASLAGAAGGKLQKLTIRRQGHGVALAVLQFVEVPLADGTPVRVYATDIIADTATRAQVARVLLAFSRLGVLLVGGLPPHALTGQLKPLHEALLRGPWPNRDLLLLPLGSGTALAMQAAQLAGGSGVAVHVTPHADKPRDAWTFVSGAWNRLHGKPGGERALPTELALAVPPPSVPISEAATQPMGLHPLGGALASARREAALASALVDKSTPLPVAGATRWHSYAERCAQIKGSVACCVFDVASTRPLAHAGGMPGAERLAQQGAALLAQLAESARALGLGGTHAEATFSSASHHVLLRLVPARPGVAVVLVILASTGNLTLARMQLERIAPQP